MSASARRHRSSNVYRLRELIEGELKKLKFKAYVMQSPRAGKTCECGGRIIKSRTTGIRNERCWECRYLRMIYGPNIKVTRVDK